ncbi:hypothetical protein GCM10007207_23430 [Asaia siamensis]|uniref:Uncharacterized protein n=1 Tax=Asaia siamensis TaxID=110479 RepID=A0ABQ1M9J7_9PROT|nr:hypothetical protein GCM10007207_23430 [Asaia siamensis]
MVLRKANSTACEEGAKSHAHRLRRSDRETLPKELGFREKREKKRKTGKTGIHTVEKGRCGTEVSMMTVCGNEEKRGAAPTI